MSCISQSNTRHHPQRVRPCLSLRMLKARHIAFASYYGCNLIGIKSGIDNCNQMRRQNATLVDFKQILEQEIQKPGMRHSLLHFAFFFQMYNGAQILVVGLMLPLLIERMSLSPNQAVVLSAASQLTYFLGSLTCAFFQIYGRKRIIQVTLVLSLLCFFGTLAADGFWVLLGFRLVSGFLIGLEQPMLMCLLCELSDGQRRSQNFAVANLAYPLGEILPTLLYSGFKSFDVLIMYLSMLCLYMFYLARWHMVQSPLNLLVMGFNREAVLQLQQIQTLNSSAAEPIEMVIQPDNQQQEQKGLVWHLFQTQLLGRSVNVFGQEVLFCFIYMYMLLLLPSLLRDRFEGQDVLQSGIIVGSVVSEIAMMLLYIFLTSRYRFISILRALYLVSLVAVAGLMINNFFFALCAVLLKGLGCVIVSAFYQISCDCFQTKLRGLTSGICVGIYGLMSFATPFVLIAGDSKLLYVGWMLLIALSYRNIDRMNIPQHKSPSEELDQNLLH